MSEPSLRGVQSSSASQAIDAEQAFRQTRLVVPVLTQNDSPAEKPQQSPLRPQLSSVTAHMRVPQSLQSVP
ncbi:MAG TPA: hypothetical protein VK509_12900, partial [Polyangiales bacterium]|nr:hypothetical protein [Polyangiales bacterium]